jgi:hypothetical protein
MRSEVSACVQHVSAGRKRWKSVATARKRALTARSSARRYVCEKEAERVGDRATELVSSAARFR